LDNQRNLIMAVLLCGLLLLGWDSAMRFFYPQAAVAPVTASPRADTPAERAAVRSGAGLGAPATAAQRIDVGSALKAGGRVPIDAPRLEGSINTRGAQIDDVTLTEFRQTVQRRSDPVRLFAPAGTDVQQFARLGFLVNGQLATDQNTQWQASGGPLGVGRPVVLTHRGASGEVYTIRLSIDDHFMITAEQTVANAGTTPFVTQPYAAITRTSKTASPDVWNIHAGPIGTFGGVVDYDVNYEDLGSSGILTPQGRPNWTGFTDQYWLSALVPDRAAQAEASYRGLGNNLYRADLIYQPQTLAPGRQMTVTTRLFAGAKESEVLDTYESTLGIAQFDKAIDWGWFYWFMKPILWLLLKLFELVGNFGVAIILLTVLVRGLMFPIAQKQFASMAAMRALQPKMKALQERYKDDKPKMQQEIMALYKEEKVNPLAGCLPILIQIPIFFALYKVLILAIEMRHQPFALWIRDLSAPDPAHILNLFGLLPFEVPGLLAIGPLAVLLGVTMWLTFKLNPTTGMDPVQQQIFGLMPWILMFVMAPFSAGLLLYWVTSNVLTVAQQSYLYSKHPQLKAAAEKEKLEKAQAAARAKQESA
jgi:YidC/Oxa1 family membrane protein insertase